MTYFTTFTFYGQIEVIKDIINYCVTNPQNLNFGEKLNITYRKLEYGFGYVTIEVDFKDYPTLCEFKAIAKLMREV